MVTVTDLFCGAGGSGLGATAVPGVELVMAANHSPRAIETHAANFPGCEHDCADISQVEPRRYRRTTILWASPECTNHSIARSRKRDTGQLDLFADNAGDPLSERSRATMWDVPRFAEVHRYDAVIVENVVDAALWAPFRAWLSAMDAYGYDHHIVYLNSMHAPAIAAPRAPQSRDRMYVVFWRKGNRRPHLDIRPRAHCATCDATVRAVQAWKRPERRWGRYRAQYVYRCPNIGCRNAVVEPETVPAASVIDWANDGQRIGDRARPLSDKTLDRIRQGLHRYGSPALVVPMEGRIGKHAQPVAGPFRTQTARHETGVAFIAELRGGGSTARPVAQPLATVCASGNHHMLIRGDRPIPEVEACRFRMLTVPEIQAAMAFHPGYIVTGTKREQVRQLGNGVTPPAAEWLIRSVMASLDPQGGGLT